MLAGELGPDARNFIRVSRPDGGEFFGRSGLLFGSVEDVRATTAKLIDAQPLLGPLAYDPSLRGVATAIATAASGAADDPADPATARLEEPLSKLHTAISATLAGKSAWFSWQQLFAPGAGDMAPPLRQVLLVQPRLDFSALKAGERAVDAIRAHAARLGFTPASGITIGITGEVPLADEEFGSIEEGMGPIGLTMAAAMLLALWFATRAWQTVAAIGITIVAGLAITLGLALLTFARLNVISIAFIPLFVELGVDFGVQVSVRFNAERHGGAGIPAALEAAAGAIGAPILLAAGAICLALGAFLPTDFVGIAELGMISAIGMVLALALNVTLLPALLVLLKPPPPAAPVGYAEAAPLDRWLEHNRRKVLLAFVLAMLASIAALPLVRFDFNPLNLRDPEAPAMAMLRNLIRDPQRTPNTLSVLAPDAEAARRLAERLGKLPEVRDAITLGSFVPADQPAKLALIEDAGLLLDPAINPFDLPPPADDGQTIAQLGKAAGELRRLAEVRPGPLGQAAALLAGDFERLAKADPALRRKAETLLVEPLGVTLDKLRLSLQASAITRETLPPELVADWVAKDGRTLVQLVPRGDSADNRVLERFSAAVRKLAPTATGMPVGTQEAARTVSRAFIVAGVLALVDGQSVAADRAAIDPRSRLHARAGGALGISDAWQLRGDRPAAQLRQHHRLPAAVRRRRRLSHLFRHGLAGRSERPAAIEPCPRHLLQRAGDRRGLRRAVVLAPSRHGEHGADPDDLAGLDPDLRPDLRAGAAGAAAWCELARNAAHTRYLLRLALSPRRGEEMCDLDFAHDAHGIRKAGLPPRPRSNPTGATSRRSRVRPSTGRLRDDRVCGPG